MTEDYSPPMGPRFSQLYVERGQPRSDSKRLRHRIGAFFETEMNSYSHAASAAIRMRIGTDQFFSGYAHDVTDYLHKCSPADFYDAVTVIHGVIAHKYKTEGYRT